MDAGVYRGELLECLQSPEAQRRAFPSLEGQISVLGPIVLPSAHLATIEVSHVARGSYPYFAAEYRPVRYRPSHCRKAVAPQMAAFRKRKVSAERLGLGRQLPGSFAAEKMTHNSPFAVK